MYKYFLTICFFLSCIKAFGIDQNNPKKSKLSKSNFSMLNIFYENEKYVSMKQKNKIINISFNDLHQKTNKGDSDSHNSFDIDFGNVLVGTSQTWTVNLTGVNFNYIQRTILPLSQSGSSNFTVTNNHCFGYTFPPYVPCSFDITYSPQNVGSDIGVINEIDIDNYPATEHYPAFTHTGYNTINLLGSSFEKPVDKVSCEKGSIIKVDNFSVSEIVPIVGTDLNMYYSSEYAPEFSSTTSSLNSINQKFSFNNEGWTNSLHHLYNVVQHRLFLGNGRVSKADYKRLADGNLLVVSPNRDEIYIFSSKGQHLKTTTFLSGAIKYIFSYDLNDRLIKITDAFNKQTNFIRDSNGKLIGIISPFGQATTINIGENGLISSIKNLNNEVYQFTYKPGTALLENFIKPSGQVTTLNYDSNGKLVKDLGSGGNFWSLTSDNNGSINKSSQMNRLTKYQASRDNNGNYIKSQIDPSGLRTDSYQGYYDSFYGSNSIYSESQDQDQDARFGWISKRNSVSRYALNGNLSLTTYNQSITFPSNTTPDLFNFILLTDTSNTSGRITTTKFDNSSKIKQIISPEGVSSKIFFDTNEVPIGYQHGQDSITRMKYDSLGRLIQKDQEGSNQSNYTYSADGFLKSITNGRNETVSYVRDLVGRVVAKFFPDGKSVSYQYDANGNVTSITPPNKPTHYFEMNAMELPSKYGPPFLIELANKDTTYEYNLDKQITKIRRPDGSNVKYNYDLVTGLLKNVEIDIGTYQYEYYPNSYQVSAIASPYGYKNKFTYYGNSIQSNELLIDGNNSVGKVSFTFDTDHRMNSRSVHTDNPISNNTVNITLNNDSKPVQYGAMSLSYSAVSGRLASTALDQVADQYEYDQFGNLSKYTASTNGNIIYSYSLTRDNMSRIFEIEETLLGIKHKYTYAYNIRGQLTSVIQDNNKSLATFNYDDNGNRVAMTLNGNEYTSTYDDQDRLLNLGAQVYRYNANGDLIFTQTSIGTQTNYLYDSHGNLRKVVLPGNQFVKNYYDGENKLVSKFNGGQVISFLYEDDLKIAAAINLYSSAVTNYYYPTGSHSADYMQTSDGLKYRIIKNHLGSPRLVVRSDDGSVAQRLDYNVLGKIEYDSNRGFQPFGFAGGLNDLNTKLVKFGARNYDTETGRWLTKDPIGFNGGDTNLYGYVLNDPVNFVDPNGLYRVTIGGVNLELNANTAVATGIGTLCGTLTTGNPVSGLAIGLVAGTVTAIAQGAEKDINHLLEQEPTVEPTLP